MKKNEFSFMNIVIVCIQSRHIIVLFTQKILKNNKYHATVLIRGVFYRESTHNFSPKPTPATNFGERFLSLSLLNKPQVCDVAHEPVLYDWHHET